MRKGNTTIATYQSRSVVFSLIKMLKNKNIGFDFGEAQIYNKAIRYRRICHVLIAVFCLMRGLLATLVRGLVATSIPAYHMFSFLSSKSLCKSIDKFSKEVGI